MGDAVTLIDVNPYNYVAIIVITYVYPSSLAPGWDGRKCDANPARTGGTGRR